MIPGRPIRERMPRGDSRAQSGQDANRSFQLTMLRACLLPPACRDVVVLNDLQGCTLSEIAAVLGISQDEVTKHLRRARRELQTS